MTGGKEGWDCIRHTSRERTLTLESKEILTERDHIQPLLKASPDLTAHIGTPFGLNIGTAQQVAYEFELPGDYAADVTCPVRNRSQPCPG